MGELISVIVPVYNNEECLGRCLDSVVSQTHTNLEIIIIDDGSIDNSPIICDEYAKRDNRVKVLHKKNGGASDARNKGLDMATGQYIGFVDGDDFIEEDFYESLYNLAKKNEADVAMVSYNIVKGDVSEPWCVSDLPYLLEGDFAIEQLLMDKKLQNYVWNKIYSKHLFEEIRFPVGVIYDDIEIMYEIIHRANKVACMDIPKYNYCIRENSLITSVNHKKFEDELHAVVCRYMKILHAYPGVQKHNAYSLILWMIRIYTYMVKSNDSDMEFLKDKYPLMSEAFEQHKEFVISHLKPFKRITLFLMLWDFDKGREVLEQLISISER